MPVLSSLSTKGQFMAKALQWVLLVFAIGFLSKPWGAIMMFALWNVVAVMAARRFAAGGESDVALLGYERSDTDRGMEFLIELGISVLRLIGFVLVLSNFVATPTTGWTIMFGLCVLAMLFSARILQGILRRSLMELA